MSAEGEQRARVGIELFAIRPKVVECFGLEIGRRGPLHSGIVCGQRVEHEGLHVIVQLLLNESFVQVSGSAVEHILADRNIGIFRERQPPEHISAHPMIAVALLPPGPAAVGMLEIIKTFEAGFDYLIELLQILFPVRMSRGRAAGFDAAENPAHDIFGLQTKIAQSFDGDDSGQEAAHRLLGATVRIIDEVWQRIEHRDRHAGRHLNRQ